METATVCAAGGVPVADCNARRRPPEENEANAQLVIAAPDLLEVLKLAVACEPEDWRMWHDDALVAIAKATGA
jgi:hypothetical protein